MNIQKKLVQQVVQEMPSITKEQLINHLKNIKSSTFIGFVAKTIPKMKKTGNPFADKIIKLAHVSANVGFDYEAGVNRRREKEGKEANFVAQSNWHKPVLNGDSITPLAEHNKTGELYLRCNVLKSDSVYVNMETGEIVEKESLEPFLQKTDYKATQGLDESQVAIACYKLDGIQSINFNGQSLKVMH